MLLINGFHLQAELNRMTAPDGTVIALEPRTARVIALLATRPGELFSRDELIAKAWDGRIVSDDAINRTLSKARIAFGDDHRSPRFIETIQRSGYRLIAVVIESAPDVVVESDTTITVSTPAPTAATRRRPRVVPMLGAAVAILVALWLLRTPAGSAPMQLLDARPLMSLTGPEFQPAQSRDGELVAFSWADPAVDAQNRDLYLVHRDGSGLRRLTDDPGLERGASFSPDGTALVYALRTGDRCEIRRIALVGGPPEVLHACTLSPAYPWPQYTADGRFLVFSDRHPDAEGPVHALEFEIATRRLRPLAEPPAGLNDVFATPAPTGTRVLVARGSDGGARELFAIDRADSGVLEQWTHDDVRIHRATWLPDGGIVLASARDGGMALWHLPEPGRALRLTGYMPDVQSPVASMTGDRLLFEQLRYEVGIAAIARDGVGTDLAVSTAEDRNIAVSNDGRRIAFVSDRGGDRALWLLDVATRQAAKLRSFGALSVQDPLWSDDDRVIALTRPDAVGATPCVIDVATATLGCYEAQGVALEFERGDQDLRVVRGGRVARLSLVSGVATPGEAVFATTARRDRDGRWLWTLHGRDGVWTLDGDALTQPTPEPPGEHYRNWTLTASGLAALGKDGGLVEYDLAGRETGRVPLPHAIDVRSGLAQLPDGRYVVTRPLLMESDIHAGRLVRAAR